MADESQQASQDEIEQLLQQAKDAAEPTASSDGALAADAAGGAAQASEQTAAAAAADQVGQDEIEALLNPQQTTAASATTTAAAPPPPPAASTSSSGGQSSPSADAGVTQGDIELLLNQAELALQSINEPVTSSPPGISQYPLPDFSGAPPSDEVATLDLMQDVQLDVTIELGRTHMYLHDVLKLKKGAVVPLDKLAGDPVDIYVNGRLIARGEVLVLNDSFCVRIAELVVGESAVA